MSVAQLNVRIGGDIRALQRSLSDAEKAVKSATARISNAARELSLKLSLPIAGFGVAALKSAGEMEALRKSMEATFKGAGRSVNEAATELEALRKAAEAPGLDFPEAVSASIRLQGVGLQAEAARETIIQLANAIASTGGTAQNLSGVTVQFSQMISKGKIMASDLRIVQENMPIISKLMEETFGTSNSERLQEMGISGKEFVEKITAAMAKLPRVEGGISNSIVNAGTAIKMFLASVGNSLNKTFDIQGKLDRFSSWLDGMAKSFDGLSDGTKRAIAGVGVFALALGPLLKVGQYTAQAVGVMIQAFGTLQIALKRSLAGDAIPSAIQAFKALNLATKLTILGAAVGVILAAAVAFKALEQDMSATAQAARAVDEVNKVAAASISEEKVKVGLLIDVLKDNTAAYEKKKGALDELKRISPEYFGNLDLEKSKITDITYAQNQYIDSILKAARAKAAEEKLIDIDKRRTEAIEKLKRVSAQGPQQSAFEAGIGGTIVSNISSQNATNSFTKDLNEQIAALDAQDKALRQVIFDNKDFTASTKQNAEAAKEHTQSTKELKDAQEASSKARKDAEKADAEETDRLAKYAKMVREIEQAWLDEAQAIEKTMDARREAGTATDTAGLGPPGGEQSFSGVNLSNPDTANMEAAAARMNEFTEGLGAVPSLAQSASDAISSMADAMAGSLESGANVWKSFAQAASNAIAEIINRLVKLAVANAMASAIKAGSINPLLGIALATAAGKLAGAAFKRLVGAAHFAKGTMNAPGGMAVVGEEGPELLNIPARSQVYTAAQTAAMFAGQSSGGKLVGEVKIQGTDLLLLVKRAEAKERRVR